MRVIESGSGAERRAPMEGGPTVEILVGAGNAEGVGNRGAARVLVPPGGGMP